MKNGTGPPCSLLLIYIGYTVAPARNCKDEQIIMIRSETAFNYKSPLFYPKDRRIFAASARPHVRTRPPRSELNTGTGIRIVDSTVSSLRPKSTS
jgi:hypothetical protein